MSLLQDVLEFNKKFVEEKKYELYETSKFPDKKMVILSCMDTRLVELLPHALNLRNGDVKMLKMQERLFHIHLEVLCEAF